MMSVQWRFFIAMLSLSCSLNIALWDLGVSSIAEAMVGTLWASAFLAWFAGQVR